MKEDYSLANPKWSGRSKGTAFGYRTFIFLFKHVGIRAAYALLHCVVPWYVITARASNRALRHFFARVRSRSPNVRLSRMRSYMFLGRSLIDRAAVRAGLAQRYTFTTNGREHLRAMADAGQGGLVISAHVGNWELASHLLRENDLRLSVVMLDEEHEAIKRTLERNTEKPAAHIIALKEDLSHLYRINAALKEGRLVCFNGDRNLPGARTLTGDLLGSPAEFPMGPFAVAFSMRVPVSFAFVVRTGPMAYGFSATSPIPVGTSVDDLFKRFVAELERTVIAHPSQWSNFFDFWNDG